MTLSLSFRRRVLFSLVAATSLFVGVRASAQDLPPVAAPTTSVAVGALPVIRSDSQVATDYARGLMDGLRLLEGIDAAAVVIVSQDRIDMAEGFGEGVDENTPFALGTLSDVFGAVSALQLVEQARLLVDEDVSRALGEAEPRGVTLGDLLTHRPDNETQLLVDTVSRASGTPYRMYISSQILTRLGMSQSRYEADDRLLISPNDMSQFLLALVNGGTAGGNNDAGRILLPATVELMQRNHYTAHQALPGWTYGFGELHRNGWRALQRDGERESEPFTQSRIVIIPETRIAYFLAVSGQASPVFWQALDTGIFDRLAPPREPPGDLRTGPAPTAEDAAAAAGIYRARNDRDAAIFLKVRREPIRVEAEGAALRLSGSANLLLQPMPGGYWRSEGTLIPAAFVDGQLRVGNGVFEPLPLWQRPAAFLVTAGLFGFLAFFAVASGTYASSGGVFAPVRVRAIGLGLAAFTALCIAVAVALRALV